jgi:hypothetical protein
VRETDKSTMKKLPKELFVSVENEGTDDEYLIANKDAAKLVEFGETKRVGLYVLKEMLIVELKPAIRKVR